MFQITGGKRILQPGLNLLGTVGDLLETLVIIGTGETHTPTSVLLIICRIYQFLYIADCSSATLSV